jgi:hypothetical protein
MKKYLNIGVVIAIMLLLSGVGILWNKYQKEKAERIRVENNQNQLLQDNAELTVLTLHKDEVIGRYKERVDSISEALRIKPKQMISYKDIWLWQTDTVTKEIPVRRSNDSVYFFTDKGPCFEFEYMAIMENDSLSVKRLSENIHNKITEAHFWKRKWFLAKKKFYQDISAECGETRTEEIVIVKK